METEQKHEHNHEKHALELIINGKHFEWHQEYISENEIRKLGNISDEDEIFLAIKKPWEDELLIKDTKINLARPEIEHFYSKDKHFEIIIIVNGRPKHWNKKTMTFEQIVVLAFESYDPNPNKVYTVTYDRGPHQNIAGSMVKNEKVFVNDKMIFNVTATDKS